MNKILFPLAVAIGLCSLTVMFAGGELFAQDGIVTFPNGLARKVGLSRGEMASIDYTVLDVIVGKGRIPSYSEVIEFEGVSESGALIFGMGTLTFEKLRAIGDGPGYVQYGKISLDWLLVEDLAGNVYAVESGTLDYQSYPLW